MEPRSAKIECICTEADPHSGLDFNAMAWLSSLLRPSEGPHGKGREWGGKGKRGKGGGRGRGTSSSIYLLSQAAAQSPQGTAMWYSSS